MVYNYNKRQRMIRRCCRLLEKTQVITSDLVDFGLYDEFLSVINHIELLFPVEYKKPNCHGL